MIYHFVTFVSISLSRSLAVQEEKVQIVG